MRILLWSVHLFFLILNWWVLWEYWLGGQWNLGWLVSLAGLLGLDYKLVCMLMGGVAVVSLFRSCWWPLAWWWLWHCKRCLVATLFVIFHYWFTHLFDHCLFRLLGCVGGRAWIYMVLIIFIEGIKIIVITVVELHLCHLNTLFACLGFLNVRFFEAVVGVGVAHFGFSRNLFFLWRFTFVICVSEGWFFLRHHLWVIHGQHSLSHHLGVLDYLGDVLLFRILIATRVAGVYLDWLPRLPLMWTQLFFDKAFQTVTLDFHSHAVNLCILLHFWNLFNKLAKAGCCLAIVCIKLFDVII